MSPIEEAKAALVRRWGEMGGYWGINRTMAEIHALLFVTRRPLCTDDIMEQLQVSRGNASMNLRALVDWGLIERVHILGDRKEYFRADTDVWRMFETIMRERRRREVEPVIATIDRCRELVTQAKTAAKASPSAGNGQPAAPHDPEDIRELRRRIDDLRNFIATMSTLFDLVVRFGPSGIGRLTRLLTAPAAVLRRGRKKERVPR